MYKIPYFDCRNPKDGYELDEGPGRYEYDRKGFWPCGRNRNTAERLSAISAVTETFGCKKIGAERGYFGRKKLFRAHTIIIFRL